MARRAPGTIQSLTRDFQRVLDPAKAPAGMTAQDIALSQSDPSRYGPIFGAPATSAGRGQTRPQSNPKSPLEPPLPPRRPIAPSPRGPLGPSTTGTASVGPLTITPGMLPADPSVPPYTLSRQSSLPGPPELPGPLTGLPPPVASPPSEAGLGGEVPLGPGAAAPQDGLLGPGMWAKLRGLFGG
jgi:hypothetical protein